jgi:hypothetical protein
MGLFTFQLLYSPVPVYGSVYHFITRQFAGLRPATAGVFYLRIIPATLAHLTAGGAVALSQHYLSMALGY